MKFAALAFAMAGISLSGADMPVEGNPASKVRIVIYEDLQCSDCADFRVMLDRNLLPKYGTKVAFEHRDFPLAKHAWARQAAIVARGFATVRPELYVAWRQYALGQQKEIGLENFTAKARDWAARNNVDPSRIDAWLSDPQLAAAVEADFQQGLTIGVAKTPTVFVDGEPFVETFSLEEISSAIDKALQ